MIAKDKLYHFIGGLAIYIGLSFILESCICLLLVLLVGVLKELIYDLWLKKGTPEVLDAVATALGGAVIMLIDLI